MGGADLFHLQAVEGWLGLGNPMEALAELDRISPPLQEHTQVLDARWQVNAALKDWDRALDVARTMLQRAPRDPRGWIHQAYATRRARSGGLQQAWDVLRPAFDHFPEVSVIPYNLACYAAQLGRPEEALEWIHRAMESAGNVAEIKAMALQDEDLRPLWPRIKTL